MRVVAGQLSEADYVSQSAPRDREIAEIDLQTCTRPETLKLFSPPFLRNQRLARYECKLYLSLRVVWGFILSCLGDRDVLLRVDKTKGAEVFFFSRSRQLESRLIVPRGSSRSCQILERDVTPCRKRACLTCARCSVLGQLRVHLMPTNPPCLGYVSAQGRWVNHFNHARCSRV